MNPEEYVKALRQERATAILRTVNASMAGRAMEAAVRGGFKSIEFTLTIPRVYDLIAEFSAKAGLMVGAGTVLTVDQAEKAAKCGAKFLVSPVVDEDVIKAATDLGVAMIPGASTPTEMNRAHRAGAPLVKLFPEPAMGPAYLRQIAGPMPFLKIVPTAGVDGGNAAAYLEAGAWAVGFVSSLFPATDVGDCRWGRITERSMHFLAAARGAKI